MIRNGNYMKPDSIVSQVSLELFSVMIDIMET
jgi:hypothetical protein